MASENKPKTVILHCSASQDYLRNSPRFDSVTANTINQWHIARGFRKIGYHYVVTRSGHIEKGREENEIGAHCSGHNTGSLGICWVGTYRPTLPQLKSLKFLYEDILQRHQINFTSWFPHNAFANKECPGIKMDELGTYFLENVLEGQLAQKMVP